MGAVTRPRGPLPRRVYWFRRLLLLALALVLVVGIATMLGASGDPSGDRATPVAAAPTASTTTDSSSASPAEGEHQARHHRKKKALPQPDGPCDDSDVVVTPSVPHGHVNRPIKVVLDLTTKQSRACTWTVDPKTVFVTISGDDGPLWSSQQCPAAIPARDVVPRRKTADRVTFLWDGMESDRGCTRSTPWVLPGDYTVASIARGSVVHVETDFVLGPALRPTQTQTVTPSESATPTASPRHR